MLVGAETISVIIPVFNRREEIARAITSALTQTRAPDEILVIDDGSSDGSVEAVEAIAYIEPRLRLLRHERNQGAAAARNTGIAAARGEWIAFLDSDDEWHPQKLAVQLETLVTEPAGTDAGVTAYTIRDYRTGEERDLVPTEMDATLDAVVWGCSLGLGSTLLVRRRIFAEIGPLDPDLPRLEDWEWLMRYLPKHRLAVLPQALALVHKRSDPSRTQVAVSVARIRSKHRAAWYRRSWLAGRRFDSSLLIEEAAAAHYTGREIDAAALALRALAAYPFRLALVRLLARRIFQRWS